MLELFLDCYGCQKGFYSCGFYLQVLKQIRKLNWDSVEVL
jgi:hypothetical protein